MIINVLELQRIIRTMPEPVIALVTRYAIGGGPIARQPRHMRFYMTEEGSEGKNALIEKRKPDFRQYP